MNNQACAPPALGAQLVDDACWRYPSRDCPGGTGIAWLRVWSAGDGHLAVVTELGRGVSITKAIADIWQSLASRFPGPLIVIDTGQATEAPESEEHLDLVHVRDRTPQWQRLWPTPPASPNHVGFDAWMAAHQRTILERFRQRPGRMARVRKVSRHAENNRACKPDEDHFPRAERAGKARIRVYPDGNLRGPKLIVGGGV